MNETEQLREGAQKLRESNARFKFLIRILQGVVTESENIAFALDQIADSVERKPAIDENMVRMHRDGAD